MNTAIVMGGGIAGLFAAAAISNMFSQVYILESGDYEQADGSPILASQSHQPHLLLSGGREAIERLFPGVSQEAILAGALEFDAGEHLLHRTKHGFHTQGADGRKLLWLSRGMLEHCVRRRLTALYQNVEICPSSTCLKLIKTSASNNTVNGVVIKDKVGEQKIVLGDFFVDATGRKALLSRYLSGIEQLEVDTGFPDCGYATGIYTLKDASILTNETWRAIFIEASKSCPRAAGIFPIEEGRLLVTAIGYKGDFPSPKHAEFEEFIHSIQSNELNSMLSKLCLQSKIHAFRLPKTRLVHFDRLKQPTKRIIALGDSVCVLNPAFGQGVTTAVFSAIILQETISECGLDSENFEKQFFTRQAKMLKNAWDLSTTADNRWNEHPAFMLSTKFIVEKYLKKVEELAVHSPAFRTKIQPVFHMLRPIDSLFKFKILAAIIHYSLRKYWSAAFGRSTERHNS